MLALALPEMIRVSSRSGKSPGMASSSSARSTSARAVPSKASNQRSGLLFSPAKVIDRANAPFSVAVAKSACAVRS